MFIDLAQLQWWDEREKGSHVFCSQQIKSISHHSKRLMEDVAGISGDAEKKRCRFSVIDGVATECYGPGSLATGPKEDGLISPRPTNQSLLDKAVETHQCFRQTVPDSCGENSIYLFLSCQHHLKSSVWMITTNRCSEAHSFQVYISENGKQNLLNFLK